MDTDQQRKPDKGNVTLAREPGGLPAPEAYWRRRWDRGFFEAALKRVGWLVARGQWHRARRSARAVALAFGHQVSAEESQARLWGPEPRGFDALRRERRAIAAVLLDIEREADIRNIEALAISLRQARDLLEGHGRTNRRAARVLAARTPPGAP